MNRRDSAVRASLSGLRPPGAGRAFERVGDDGAARRVERPACGHRFEPVEHPWLN
jgi:hypothetical protein